MSDIFTTGFSRVFFSPDGGGTPRARYTYEGFVKAGTPNWNFGDITKIETPSPSQYDAFVVSETLKGSRDLPTLGLMARSKKSKSAFLSRAARGCEFDVQIHIGSCASPNDFNGGWADGHILIVEGANITSWSTDGDIGAMSSDDRNAPMEQLPVTGRTMYQITPLVPKAQAGALITDEVVDVAVCDAVACGSCGLPSDGCSVFFALVAESSGSPGAGAKVIYTKDGGATYGSSIITSLGLTDNASRMACVGTYLVVISEAGDSLHYIPIADLVAGLGGWTAVTTGIVAAGSPRAIWSYSATATWIAGALGYIYFSDDIAAGVSTQEDGTLTTETFNDIHGIDDENVVAVGANNTVLVTTNGGDTWSLVTGPSVGVALNTVEMISDLVWLVGDAGGQLWYTVDGGANWTERTFSGSGGGQVRHVSFVTRNVGYMAHDSEAGVGRVFRTIDGGASWYQVPEASGLSFPDNDRINRVAPCPEVESNILIAGGLNADGQDGILVKAA